MIGTAATGIEKVEYKDGNLIFTLPDGSTISTPLDIESGIQNVKLNEETNTLEFSFADGTTLSYAAATPQQIQNLEEKLLVQENKTAELEDSQNLLLEDHNTLKQAFEGLGLSVVDGKLNITYEEDA